ncbi:hypothetical protein HanRHA438_Chr13g0591391 [Helianthus annuus]|nr:hypothetical protein HanRHA438_Chr13g0591391 [Helianthus annuus]
MKVVVVVEGLSLVRVFVSVQVQEKLGSDMVRVWGFRTGVGLVRSKSEALGLGFRQRQSDDVIRLTRSNRVNSIKVSWSTQLTRSTQSTHLAFRHEILVKSIGAINSFVILYSFG